MSDDWWTERRQNRRINELQDEVDAAYAFAAERSRAMQSRLADVQGTLERRLNRLATSFDAFVELSDLRMELAMFDREATVRHRTRRLIAGAARPGAGDPPPLDLEPCPGYWLAPAAEALAATLRGDAPAARKYADEACARDEGRTALFLTLALTAAGRAPAAAPWLERAMPPLEAQTGKVTRRLWTACADGVFGEPGRAHLERRLTNFVDALGTEESAAERAAWRAAALALAGRPAAAELPHSLRGETALTEPEARATALARFRALVQEALRPAEPGASAASTAAAGATAEAETGASAEAGAERPATPVATAGTASTEQPSTEQPSAGQPSAGQPSAGQPSAGQPSPGQSSPALPAELAEALTTLVDEGSPQEREPIRRARELRQIIEQGGAEHAEALDAPAGRTIELLRGDVFARSRPGPRAAALRAGRPWATAVATELADEAVKRPPGRVSVRIGGHSLSIGAGDVGSLAEAEAGIDAAYTVGPTMERIGVALAAGGVIVLALGIATGLIALAVLAGVAAVVGAGCWGKSRIDRRRAAESVVHEKARLARDAQQIADALARYRARHNDLTVAAVEDRDVVISLLSC